MTAKHLHTALAIGTSLTLGVSAAAALGAIPHADSPGRVASAPVALARTVTPSQAHAATGRVGVRLQSRPARASHTGHAGSRPATATHPTQPPLLHASGGNRSSAPVPVAATGGSPSAHPSHHPANASSAPRHHHSRSAGTHPSKPAKSAQAARTHPSSAAIAQAITGLRNYVHSLFKPTASQVAEFGDLVCTALDHHERDATIKSTILQKVAQLPFTTVLPGAADYVIRTAVNLYCGGYSALVGGS